uniref:Probable magnesium transporter n=1 Tax=Ananas comosus var. bracteatus TaxID=296719 RepID=A0A6V7P144_ANACO|nr:unnamed protein product [Ananas comosus var. bracteatus]
MADTAAPQRSEGGGWAVAAYRALSADNVKGLVLALSSSVFIGASFIVKKKGLQKPGRRGLGQVRDRRSRSNCSHYAIVKVNITLDVTICMLDLALGMASQLEKAKVAKTRWIGGYSYLYEPLWWAGMVTMIVGEIANFAAYAFAPAILVTPLGALSIIISAALAYVILREKLHIFWHACSVTEVWDLAMNQSYTAIVLAAVFILIFRFAPHYGQTYIMVYIGICSLIGSLTVMSVKALGMALKLTFSGVNQLVYPQTWAFTLIVAACVITQINYLIRHLTHSIQQLYHQYTIVMFTSLTILASVIMFKDWDGQNPTQIVTEMCGFVTILSGTFLLHKTKDMVDGLPLPVRLENHADEDGFPPRGFRLESHNHHTFHEFLW